jgi:hypothetical protein
MCAIWLAAVDGSSPPAKLTAITLTASLTGQAERFLPELVTGGEQWERDDGRDVPGWDVPGWGGLGLVGGKPAAGGSLLALALGAHEPCDPGQCQQAPDAAFE